MPKHVIEEDLLLTLEDYVKKIENTPNRIVTTNANGDIVVKQDLNVSQLDHLKNVTGDIQFQINEKSDVNHTHSEYLTLEGLKDVNFSGVAEDVVYNPENSTLDSTNVRDAIDEVDNKLEEYKQKLIEDKAELKQDISNNNEAISGLSNTVKLLNENKADKNHTHEGTDHIHEDINLAIADINRELNDTKNSLAGAKQEIAELPERYASKSHTHQDLQSQIDAINTDITDHRHQYLEDAITTVNEKVNENKESIISHKESISSIRENIANLEQGKADINHTHDASDHVHQDILDRIDTFNEDFAKVNERISSEAERVDNTFAEKSHSHTEYADKNHTHDFSYEHNHDGVYAPNFHTHNNYADVEHYHNELYSPIDHSHTGEFAPAVHTHSDLANKEHTHREFADFVSSSEKNVAYGIATLDEHCKIPVSQMPDTAKPTNIIGTQAERLALAVVEVGTIFRETDTGDSYIYDGSSWVILADADWANVKLQWTNIEGIPTEFNPIQHTHEEYASIEHTHYANKIHFEDGESLQQKLDEGSLGGGSSSGGGDCNVVISAEAPTNLPVGGIWIDISNL